MPDGKLNGQVEAGKLNDQVEARLTGQRVNKPEETDGRLIQFGKNDEKERKGACSTLRPALLLGSGKKRWYVSYRLRPSDIMLARFCVLFAWPEMLCPCVQNPSCRDENGPLGTLLFLLSSSRDGKVLLHASSVPCSES